MPLKISSSLSIPDEELIFSFIHSSGPGGQNVNKLSSGVQLRYDVYHSASLPELVKERLVRLAGHRISQEGILLIEAKRYRSQEQNRADALNRLKILLEKAQEQPLVRHPTRPSRSAQIQRLDAKKKHGKLKKQRQPLHED